MADFQTRPNYLGPKSHIKDDKKFCFVCNQWKIFADFNRDSRAKTGLQSKCRECQKNINNQSRYKEHRNRYKAEHRKLINERALIYYQKNKKEIALRAKEYSKQKKEQIRLYKRVYSAQNRARLSENNRVYNLEKRAIDLNWKLRDNLRCRLHQALKNNQKSGSAVRDLGCSIPELKVWLEQQFQPGMTWENYGNKKGQWDIDHILPLSKFDLIDRKQFLKANHWFNLQPLWVEENQKKSNKIC